MNKEIQKVPFGIKYISEWADYVMPEGHCIVDKGITGCGYTEMCLTNNLDVILCSPRKLLLENKAEQHKDDKNILYLVNDLNEKSDIKDISKFYDRIENHIYNCRKLNKPVKFMITYDSVRHLINYLSNNGVIKNYYLIADEFQSIFLDSYFKADVENSFVEVIQACTNIIYLSATPMLDKYLLKVPEFKNLKYYKIDWSESGYVETIKVQRKQASSLSVEIDKVIKSYLEGNYPITLTKDNRLVQSKEAVLYFNSVTEITRAINRNNLSPEQVNILCSSSSRKSDLDNIRKIKKLGDDWSIGKIPTKNEPNKMFTFCTSTSYVGADFYSKCASTYVFADPNLKCLALDISLDLPQIAGRQRDRENPFKNNITIFYRTLRDENIESKEDFDKLQEQRRNKTNLSLDMYYNETDEAKKQVLMDGFIAQAEHDNYKNNFISISKITGKPVYNKLIEIANERAWEVAQKDYQDIISVTKALEDLGAVDIDNYQDKDYQDLLDFEDKFYSTGNFAKKLKLYCEFMDKYLENDYIQRIIPFKVPDPKFKSFYNKFGTAGCKAKKFREEALKTELLDTLKDDILTKEILDKFKLKDKLSKKLIKTILASIYLKLSLKRTAKASDLEEWFDLRSVNFMENGKKVNGFEIIALKGQN